MKYRLFGRQVFKITGLCLFLISSEAFAGKKLSPDFKDFLASSTPNYCSPNQRELEVAECSKKNSAGPGPAVEKLSSLANNIQKENFRTSLIQISIERLLRAKAGALTAFPSLRPGDESFSVSTPSHYRIKNRPARSPYSLARVSVDKSGQKKINACLEKIVDPKVRSLDKQLTRELGSSGDSASLIGVLSQACADSLEAERVWEKKLINDEKLEKLFEERRILEADLNLLSAVISGEYNKRSNGTSLVGGSQALLYSSKSREANLKRQGERKKQLEKKEAEITELLQLRDKYNKSVFANPLLVDFTNVFEKGKIKQSPLMQGCLETIKAQGGSDEFIESFASSREKGLDIAPEVMARMEFMLKEDEMAFKRLRKLASEASSKKIQEIDESLEEICDSEGEKLHHFKPLVAAALDENKSSKEALEQAHCALLEEIPYEESHMSLYAAIGAGMLATGVLAPVGAGVVLAAGGVALSGVGAYETYQSMNSLRLSTGLAKVELADMEKARRDLSAYRANMGWTIADGALLPLDAAVLAKKGARSFKKSQGVFRIKEKDKQVVSPPPVDEPFYKTGVLFDYKEEKKVSLLKKMLNKEKEYMSEKLKQDPDFLAIESKNYFTEEELLRDLQRLQKKHPREDSLNYFDGVVKKFTGEMFGELGFLKENEISLSKISDHEIEILINPEKGKAHKVRFRTGFTLDEKELALSKKQLKEFLTRTPRKNIRVIKNIEVAATPHPYVEDVAAEAAGGQGKIIFYKCGDGPHPFCDQRSTHNFVHETGHLVAKDKFKSFTPKGWIDVMNKDLNKVSEYGSVGGPNEDFAETFALYMNNRFNFPQEGKAVRAAIPSPDEPIDGVDFVRMSPDYLSPAFQSEDAMISAADVREKHYHRFRYIEQWLNKHPKKKKSIFSKFFGKIFAGPVEKPVGKTPAKFEEIRYPRNSELESEFKQITKKFPKLKSALIKMRKKLDHRFGQPAGQLDLLPFFRNDPGRPAHLKGKMRMKIEELTPLQEKTILDVFNTLNDAEYAYAYMKALYMKTATRLAKRGRPQDLAQLEKGKFSIHEVTVTLVKSLKKKTGNSFSVIEIDEVKSSPGASNIGTFKLKQGRNEDGIKRTQNEQFRRAVANGPFFDDWFSDFPNDFHSSESHLLQHDMVHEVIKKHYGAKTKEFWEFLGSKKGVKWWNDLFDSTNRGSPNFNSPEQISSFVGETMIDPNSPQRKKRKTPLKE